MNADPVPASGKLAIVVLGAGRPVRGNQPSALHKAPDHRTIFDWIGDAFGDLNADWHFVGGYHMEEMVRAYPSTNFSVNADWRVTGSCASLFVAPINGQGIHYVSYADIIFSSQVVADLQQAQGDVVLAVDSTWRNRYDRRALSDMDAAEKVCLNEDQVTEIDSNIDSRQANAEFIGLAKFSPKAMQKILDIRRAESGKFNTAPLPALIARLKELGETIRAVDVRGDWAELNAPQDLARYVLGTKAETLARLGPMVRHSHIGEQVSFSVSQWQTSPDAVIERIQGVFEDMDLAVRSSARSEDSWLNSNAGAFLSLTDIPSNNGLALRDAIKRVAASYQDRQPDDQLLVQQMVADVRISGVAVTRTLSTGAPYYVINYDAVSGRSDTVTGGTGKNLRTMILHRGAGEIPSDADPGFVKLLKAIKELEALVGHDSLDVEFIITDHDQIEILQLRPIAVDHNHWNVSDQHVSDTLLSAQGQFVSLQSPGAGVVGSRTLFGVMPDWNPAEIIGTKPRKLALSLYRNLVTDDVWAAQRAEYGYTDVRPHPLMVTFMGHPFIDVRASFNSFIPQSIDRGLAERLIEHYLKKLLDNPQSHDKVEFDILFTCWTFDVDSQVDRLRQDGFNDTDIAALKTALKTITCNGFERLDSDLNDVKTLSRRRIDIIGADTGSLDKAIRLIDDCRRYGTLPFAHLARSAFIAIALLRSAVASLLISEERQTAFMNSLNTVARQLSTDGAVVAAGQLSRNEFYERYGHLRPGTYEITSARYDADPEIYLDPLIQKSGRPGPKAVAFSWNDQERNLLAAQLESAGIDISPDGLESFMRKAIEGREYAKFIFTRNLSDALEHLADWSRENDLTREQISHLDMADLRGLEPRKSTPDRHQLLLDKSREGSRQYQLAQSTELPPLIMNEKDLAAFHIPDSHPNFISTNKVIAPVADLSGSAKPDDDLTGRIVFIPQADPGFDWLFGLEIAGLITMYGGANSHMAIRAAEFSLPAAIGIGEIQYDALSRAQVLELDCSTRNIRIVLQ